MKLRIADRILVGFAGLILIACCAGISAQLFFQVDLIGLAERVFHSGSSRVRAGLISIAVFLLMLGVYCIFVLFRHRRHKDQFVTQRNDSGELAISIKALETMVNKCVDQHDEIQMQNLNIDNNKDGLLIRLNATVAGGISIPLTVEAMQRQIKQYVTACSGIEIKKIRVEVESSGPETDDATFAIEAPTAKPLLKEENRKENKLPEPEPAVPQEPQTIPAAASGTPAPIPEIPEDEDDRPLHQRLFTPKAEPCIVPEPPEVSPETEGSDAEELPEEEILTESKGFPADIIPSEEKTDLQEEACPDAEKDPVSTAFQEVQTDLKEEEEDKARQMAREVFSESQNVFDQIVQNRQKGNEES